MMRAVLAAAVLLPTLSLADEVWRWRDPSGRLHYANVRARAPRYAEPVTTEIGHASCPPVSAKTVATRPGPRAALGEPRLAFRHPTRARGCWPFGYRSVVLNNPHELGVQVKHAPLLDAVGGPQRKGCRRQRADLLSPPLARAGVEAAS